MCRVFLASLKNNLGDKRLQWIAASDIGHFAALAFGDLDEYNHKAIGLAGDNLNVSEVTKAFETALNYNQQPAFGFLGSVLTTLVSEVGLMVRYVVLSSFFRYENRKAVLRKILMLEAGGLARTVTGRILKSAGNCILSSRHLTSGSRRRANSPSRR
jgi:hypothetical protein